LAATGASIATSWTKHLTGTPSSGTLKVNYSKENPNETFLSHYPKIADYPHFFVLDSKGVLLHSQPTRGFEHGKKYNAGKIDAFLTKWAQPPRHWLNLEKPS
jgi:hypothetical protein